MTLGGAGFWGAIGKLGQAEADGLQVSVLPQEYPGWMLERQGLRHVPQAK
jgi:hypothetical protein